MEATFVQLFTSMECPEESDQLRTLLRRGGYPFRETDLTARPDYHTELLKRFGQDFTVPGILLNQQWFGWTAVTTNSTALADEWLSKQVLQAEAAAATAAADQEEPSNSSLFEQVWMETCFSTGGLVGDAAHTDTIARRMPAVHRRRSLATTTSRDDNDNDDDGNDRDANAEDSDAEDDNAGAVPSSASLLGEDDHGDDGTMAVEMDQDSLVWWQKEAAEEGEEQQQQGGADHDLQSMESSAIYTSDHDYGPDVEDATTSTTTIDKSHVNEDYGYEEPEPEQQHNNVPFFRRPVLRRNSCQHVTKMPRRNSSCQQQALVHHKAQRRNSASALLAMMDGPDDINYQALEDDTVHEDVVDAPKKEGGAATAADDSKEPPKHGWTAAEDKKLAPRSPTSTSTTTSSQSSTSTTTREDDNPKQRNQNQRHDYDLDNNGDKDNIINNGDDDSSKTTRTHNHHRAAVATATLLQQHLPSIRLPNGSKVTVGALTRLLLKVLDHDIRVHPGNGKHVYSFRGIEGLELWTVLFFQHLLQEEDEDDDDDFHHPTLPEQRPSRQMSTASAMVQNDVESFGRMLVERGIVHNYTPNLGDFSKAFLVLQPLKDPQILNSFVQWPCNSSSKGYYSLYTTDLKKKNVGPLQAEEGERPIDVILRLSCLMDEICNNNQSHNTNTNDSHVHQEQQSPPSYNWRLFQEYEVACCQLQVVDFPSDKTERVAFLINLFNLLIRHAMILAVSANRSGGRGHSRKGGGNIFGLFVQGLWPTSLSSLQDEFFCQIGYDIGGVYMTMDYLQTCLYGTHQGNARSEVAPPSPQLAAYIASPPSSSSSFKRRNRFMSRIRQWLNPTSSCRCSANSDILEHGTNVCFTSPIICNDPRLLMATTWGTRSSPMVTTLYPNHLDQGLCAAVQTYVRTQVQVITGHTETMGGVVVLPALLAWHRHDFGSEPEKVLESILPYMSVQQLRQINHVKNETNGSLHVVFDGQFDWTPGIICVVAHHARQSHPPAREEPDEDSTLATQPAEVEESYQSCYTSNVDEITTILELAPDSTCSTTTTDSAAANEERAEENGKDNLAPLPPPDLQRRNTSSSSTLMFGMFGRTTAPQASVGDDVAALPVRRNSITATGHGSSNHSNQQKQQPSLPKVPPEQPPQTDQPMNNDKYAFPQETTDTSQCDDFSTYSNDGRSVVFQCDVSEITYGSEFRDSRTTSRGIHGLWRSRYAKGE